MQLSLVSAEPQPQHEQKPAFAQFWQLYPRKIGRRYAEKCWQRLSASEQAQAIDAIPNHVKAWRNEGRPADKVPHASTWLNGGRWEDELECDLGAAPASCRWSGCKAIGIVARGSAHYCERHIAALNRGETP